MGGGLISGRNLRGARELLFKFAMLAVAVTPSRHVIRITTTIIPPVSSGINARVCTLEREREKAFRLTESHFVSLRCVRCLSPTFRNPKPASHNVMLFATCECS